LILSSAEYLAQAHRQDLAAGAAKNQKGEPHFSNTILDVCSNLEAKREMAGTPISNGGAGATGPSLATTLICCLIH